MTIVLNESEIKEAVAMYVSRTYGVITSPDNFSFFVSCDGEVNEDWDELTIEGTAELPEKDKPKS